jgi:hypothetical protein
MSILKVANVHFDSAGTNRIDYVGGDNIVRVTSGAVKLPVGDTASRPTAEQGLIRFNSETGSFEGRNATAWGAIGGGGGGSVTITDQSSVTPLQYITFTTTTSGTASSINVASTKLTFNVDTGTLSSTVFNSTSDINKKTNITQITDAVTLVNLLNGVRFDWKDNGLPSLGVIAQEVEKVLPELVGDEKSVNYNGLIAVLIEAVKDLSKQVEELKNR